MKGLILIFIIYLLTLALCAIVKIINNKLDGKKKSIHVDTPKIYYVTPQKKARKKIDNTIPIKATMVEKEKLNK